MKNSVALLLLILLVTGCSQSAPPTDASVITSRSDAWDAALNTQDIDALVELYTEDARVLPPNRTMASGRDAVRAEFGAMLDAGLGSELTSIEAKVSGSIGYNVGTYTLTDGDTLVDSGKFIETWQRGDDGQWRISNDIYNSDRPAADAEGPMTHLVITHEVDDVEHWLAAWRGDDSRHSLFEDNGATHVHTFRGADDSNLAGLVISVSDRAALDAMLESEEGKAAAAEDGVRMETIKVYTEAE